MKITTKVIWENRYGENISWFHPKVARTNNGHLLMTLQAIEGSDYYLPMYEALSEDEGESWSEPRLVPDMGHCKIGNGIIEAVCDVVPEYHAASKTVLAIGHNVYYKNGSLFDTFNNWDKGKKPLRLQRYPVYAIRNSSGEWSVTRKKLEVPGFEENSSYTSGCSQKIFIDNFLYIPMTFGLWGRKDRQCTSIKCCYDGNNITVIERGSLLELPVGRGLMEPQLCYHMDHFLMTLRTEDGYGYYSISKDGLNWDKMKPWAFDTGELLVMTNTQQHWLQQNDKLYLIYNRQLSYNKHLFRWRAPLLIAEVDPEMMTLIRSSEQVVFPMIPEDSNVNFAAALYGNFHPINLSKKEALITVGEERSFGSYFGNTLIARLSHV